MFLRVLVFVHYTLTLFRGQVEQSGQVFEKLLRLPDEKLGVLNVNRLAGRKA
jgi:hypothetical protein